MNTGVTDLDALAAEVGRRLTAAKLMVSAAESCTGGWIARVLTDIPGSSGWFERGFVTYSNESKVSMLGVQPATLAAHGAVSEAVVREMAQGSARNSRAQVAVAVSGIAGPDGGSPEKPVGTVWIGWRWPDGRVDAHHHLFKGGREQVRRQAVVAALEGLRDGLKG